MGNRCTSITGSTPYCMKSEAVVVVATSFHLCLGRDKYILEENHPCPSVQIFRKRILYSQFLESEIAKKRNKIELHDSKWMTTLENF